jgi:hypothetical protein
MKKALKLIILMLQQKGIITAKEFADLLDEIKNATATNLRRDRRKEDGAKKGAR